MSESLKDLSCDPCPPGAKELGKEERELLMKELSSGWEVVKGDGGINILSLNEVTNDFKESLEKANLIGKMADVEWHHPEVRVAFKSLKVEIHTHVIKGLRKADFIFAAKVDDILGLSPRSHNHS